MSLPTRTHLTRSSTPFRAAALALACAAAAALSACTYENTYLRSPRATPIDPDSRARSVPVEHDAYAALGYRLEWRGFPAMSPGGHVRFIEVFGDVLAVQESGSIVSLMESQSGITRWADQLANPLTKFLGLVRENGRIVASSETDAYFLAIDTGVLADRFELSRVASTRPLTSHGMLIYGAANGEVFSHFADRGFRFWGNAVRGSVDADPVMVGPYGAVISQTGEILFFDPASGSGLSRAQIRGGVAGSLAASDTTLFVASLDQSLYAIDARSGMQLWRKRTDTPLRSSPTYFDGGVYLDIPGQGLTAFNASSGRQLWANKDARGRVVAVRNGRLLAWDAPSSTAVTLDPATGDIMERAKLTNIAHIRTDRFEDGNLYTASPNGVVAKLIPR